MNPLAKLCDQLGLTPDGLAGAAALDPSLVRAALADDPGEPLGTFLAAAGALGVRMRINAAREPFVLWVAAPAVDALHRNNAWRKTVGLAPLPADRGQLVAWIRFTRTRHKWTYGQIKDHLEANYVPTMDGLPNWRGSTIGQIVNGGKVADALAPLTCGEQMARKWRRHVTQELTARMSAADPFASVRYQIEWAERDRHLVFEARHPVPECAARWMVEGVKRLGWFDAGEWGFGPPPTTSGMVVDG